MIGASLRRLIGSPILVTLANGTTVSVQPFTIEDYDTMDELEPGVLSPREYARLRLFMALRDAPGFELEGDALADRYAAWKLVCDGEVFEGLEEVRRAVERANATFRHREPRQRAPEPPPPTPVRPEHPPVGSGESDARPA